MAAAALAIAGLTSCDSAIYDEQGDCDSHYYVRFKFDYNMNKADAFASEVEQVTLHLVDADGNIVWRKTESGPALAEDGYRMAVDVAPGTYTLLAWCSSADPTSFTAGDGARLQDLTVTFKSDVMAGGGSNMRHIRTDLGRLYHGYEANVTFPVVEGGEYTHLLPLIKDTNHITIALQQLNGEPINKDIVNFEIIDDNICLNWDNSIIAGNEVTYHEWHKDPILADLSTEVVGRATGKFAGVVAELTTSRLMYDHHASTRLRVYRTDTGKEIVSIRLIDALLLVKGYYNRNMSDQEFLDRKDDYNLTFFLNEDQEWLGAEIVIESWRVVYQEHQLES